jgi:hypothetical protein
MACLLQWLCLHRRDSISSESFTLVDCDALSTLADSDALFTTSYSSDRVECIEVDSRLYRNYREAEHYHPLPSDEREKERLQVQHVLWLKALQGRLILAPIQPARQDIFVPIQPAQQNILDARTRFESWAICFTDLDPSARVINTDLTPIQPKSVPPNCEFQIFDEESL